MPDTKSCFFGSSWPGTQAFVDIGASSNHPGGVNCLFLDGTVRFIKDTVDLDTRTRDSLASAPASQR